MREKTEKRKKKGILRKIITRLLLLAFLIGGAAVAAVTLSGYELYREAVEAVPVNEKLEEIQGKENFTSYEELPQRYIDAVIAAEDRRFFRHHGFDILATSRAAWHNIEAMSLVEGGSTITQQLAKNMYFTQEKKFSRKVAEIFVSKELEKLCDKETLFELYVNSIYFGSGYYSVYDAAQGYYGKEPSELDDYECTMLAGVPNAPSVYSPDVNPTLAEERRQQVLECMAENGFIEVGELGYIEKAE